MGLSNDKTMGFIQKKDTLIDMDTGQLFEQKRKELGDANFIKTWPDTLFAFKRKITGKDKDIFDLLTEIMDKRNRAHITIKNICNKYDFSIATVKRAMSIMKEHDAIRLEKNGKYMINPNMASRVSHEERIKLIREYNSIKKGFELKEKEKSEELKTEYKKQIKNMTENEKKELVETFLSTSIGVEALSEYMFQQAYIKK